jgi:hypothetical protein
MKAVELELDQEDWFAIWTESMAMTPSKAFRLPLESKTKHD